eukprot:TRINITY_DN93982_c0_g1_i1.p1 TRINITY_DN93982_c0_g1~~TRINITY_DN93982_c0_g1_i1.p1  ORF type:complete len:344 (-),score=74.94 TRINITY_DN93982_c0_g1_i1:65-1096(-)
MASPKRGDENDFYKILGVERNATPGEIKSTYRRLAIQFHPDKNPSPEAAEKFKEISVAYAVLSDPNKRHRYDQGEMDTAEVDSLDLGAMGVGSKIMVAFLSKLGVSVPTAVSPKVLSEAQGDGASSATVLALNNPAVCRKLTNQRADFYKISVTEEQAERGVSVIVSSKGSNRFKLLYFDATGSLQLTADSFNLGKAGTVATMDFCGFDAYYFDRTAANSCMLQPEDNVPPVFRQLDTFHPTRFTRLPAGTHLFAVFADNFFLRLDYSIRVTTCSPAPIPKIVETEKELVQHKQFLHEFEYEFMKAKEAYDKARATMDEHAQKVDELLRTREALYEQYRQPNA